MASTRLTVAELSFHLAHVSLFVPPVPRTPGLKTSSRSPFGWISGGWTSGPLDFRAVVLRAVDFLALDFRAVDFLALDFRAVVLRAVDFLALDFRAVVLRAVDFLALDFRGGYGWTFGVCKSGHNFRSVDFLRTGLLGHWTSELWSSGSTSTSVTVAAYRPPALAAFSLTAPAASSALSTAISSILSTTAPTTPCAVSVARTFFPVFLTVSVTFDALASTSSIR